MMLHTERATRGQQRAFVRYGDLLDDWTRPVFALGEAFDLAGVKTAMAVDIAEVHRFIDPSLRRVTNVQAVIGRGVAAAERIFSVLDSVEETDSGSVAVDRVRGELVFDRVSLRYAEDDGDARHALRDVSFRARPGTVTATSPSPSAAARGPAPRLFQVFMATW